ncbi:arsenate reductase ArsC [Acidimicrobiaceae bacterium]|nr:arsenate reductase ArsC [Acidimicrobiaceae bacterium]|tara:strand:- start:951 stop:1355 length:405 start_codon:yes stop_codon:yes gene_type:complete
MKILVVCTGNSCRSQIAEGLIKNRFPDFEVFSAGTHPESNVNPYAVRVMQENEIDISSHYPKLVDDFLDTEFDYVLTVCDSANELCPVFPNAKNRIHKSFVDPKRDHYDSEEHALKIYTQTVQEISDWIETITF